MSLPEGVDGSLHERHTHTHAVRESHSTPSAHRGNITLHRHGINALERDAESCGANFDLHCHHVASWGITVKQKLVLRKFGLIIVGLIVRCEAFT